MSRVRVRAVVLDMDGTLCDTETVWRDAAFEVAAQLGVALSLADYLTVVGLPGPAARARLSQVVDADFPLDAWLDGTEQLAHARCAEGVPLKTGAHELLDALAAAALPVAVCTSSTHAAVERHLGPTGVLARLDAVVAQGDYARGKPDPEPYLVAAARLGAAPGDCLAVEDSTNGLRSAIAAGCVTVAVPDLAVPDAEVLARCAHVVADLLAVRRLV